MKASITQKDGMGSGIACVAFIADISYGDALTHAVAIQAATIGYSCPDLITLLAEFGRAYRFFKVLPLQRPSLATEGVIVFIARSKRYPFGHYLARSSSGWMDPWLNLTDSVPVSQARSGFRDKLPGRAEYALVPRSITDVGVN